MSARRPNATRATILRPILQIVFHSKEVELSRRTIPTAGAGEIALRFVLRPDDSVAKRDQTNNADLASPLEFLGEPGDLDEVLVRGSGCSSGWHPR